jgi:hypothetical protein
MIRYYVPIQDHNEDDEDDENIVAVHVGQRHVTASLVRETGDGEGSPHYVNARMSLRLLQAIPVCLVAN